MTVKLPRLLKNKLVWIPALAVLLLAMLICLRGWVRNSVVPAYVGFTYGKQLERTADRQLTPVETKLQPFGFDFKELPGLSPGKTCELAYFHNLKETVHCNVSFGAKFTPTTEQQQILSSQGDDIEHWLTHKGWTRQQTYYAYPIRQFFNNDYASTTYNKQDGLAECSVIINWQKSQIPTYPTTLEAFTTCNREVTFFGGNDSLYDPPLF